MTADEESMIQCYNKGCGLKFDPKANGPESCIYHPGPQYFHDAYKIWNCCNKKSTDFGTWLNFKGCTKGPHNPEKPEATARITSSKEIRPEKKEEVIVWNGLNKPAERVRQSGNVVLLGIETTSGARAAIERYQAQSGASSDSTSLRIGTACHNAGCDKTFAGPDSELSECVYHPGVAIFHEGMKYWSCCQKKTSDFGAFLEQKGCERGKHNWTKNEKVDKLREDWFSSNGMITINVYCKGAMPENVRAETDGLNLRVVLVHGFGTKESTLNYELFGEIIPDQSLIRVGERKVELVLKQKDVIGWPRLHYEVPQQKETTEA